MDRHERDAKRAKLVSDALFAGNDPATALIEHDEALSNDKWHAGGKTDMLVNPSWEEKVAGADQQAIANSRVATSLESVEVQTSMHEILTESNDLELATNVLKGLSKFVKDFKPTNNKGANVTNREFLIASKIILQVQADAREFHIQRMRTEHTDEITVEADSDAELGAQAAELAARMTAIHKQLARGNQ